MSLNLSVGSKVPLFLNVGDGNDDLYPTAKVIDDQSNVLGTFNLLPIGNGQYGYSGLVMPDVTFINVVYTSYTDTAHTTQAFYYVVTETFAKGATGDDSSLSKLTEYIEVELGDYDEELEVIVEKRPN